MNLLINGKQKKMKDGTSLLDVLELFNNSNEYFAVAVNQEFIPRLEYSQHLLMENDNIEIVSPQQGG
jgi:sulfur carrier protein